MYVCTSDALCSRIPILPMYCMFTCVIFFFLLLFLAMAATTVYGHVCLLWYNQADWSVYYYNVTSANVVKYSTMKEHTVIVSMAAYDISDYKGLNKPYMYMYIH